MLFAEEYARILLVVHTVVAAAAVAASTHLVVWLRELPRGQIKATRVAGTRKLAAIAAALYVVTVIAGNVIYPVYKVRVRLEYLENPGAMASELALRQAAGDRVRARYEAAVGKPQASSDRAQAAADRAQAADAGNDDAAAELAHDGMKIARWFDVKEHWVALGMVLSLAVAVILRAWNPKRDDRAIALLVFLMATGAAAAAWIGGVIGILVASWRAVGY